MDDSLCERTPPEQPAAPAVPRPPVRIGVILLDEDIKLPSLKFLIVSMNCVQTSFEYEILPLLPPIDDHPLGTSAALNRLFLNQLSERQQLSQEKIRTDLGRFGQEYCNDLGERTRNFQQHDLPDRIVLVSLAQFDNNYYSMRQGKASIVALGNWERSMAPPTIFEFIQTLIVRESVASICSELCQSVHFGTRGCVCDFTQRLDEARLKVLVGHVCRSCRDALSRAGYASAAADVEALLGKEWLGKLDDPVSRASVLSKLGTNLFVTTGLKPTFWESALQVLRSDGLKEILKVVGVVLGLLIAFLLGLKS